MKKLLASHKPCGDGGPGEDARTLTGIDWLGFAIGWVGLGPLAFTILRTGTEPEVTALGGGSWYSKHYRGLCAGSRDCRNVGGAGL